MASINYTLTIEKILNGTQDFSGTFKAALYTASYSPNKDTDEFRSGISGEASGTGYTAGGQSVTVTVADDTATDRVNVTFSSPLTWEASSITARYLVIYKDTGNAATDPLFCCIDNGSEVTSSSSDFTFTISAPLVFQN